MNIGICAHHQAIYLALNKWVFLLLLFGIWDRFLPTQRTALALARERMPRSTFGLTKKWNGCEGELVPLEIPHPRAMVKEFSLAQDSEIKRGKQSFTVVHGMKYRKSLHSAIAAPVTDFARILYGFGLGWNLHSVLGHPEIVVGRK